MQLPEFRRDITKIHHERLEGERQFIQVVTGPRQVGKTTAIQQVLQDIGITFHYAAADLPAPPSVEWITQQWDMARIKLGDSKKVILVLDEVQKISGWSTIVKRLWDEDTRKGNNIQVVVLGSSALLIQRGLGESLAGRFETIGLSHWPWPECQACFNITLDQFIYFGGYPGALNLIEDERRWCQYLRDSLIETAISKDIFLLNRIEKPALLRQLFALACEYGGQVLSYQKMLGQLTDAGNTTTLAHYQRLLESAFLIRGLPKWSGGLLRQRSSSPKWLPLNTALMTAFANLSFQEWRSTPDKWGRLIEVAAGAFLFNEGAQHGIELYYWREGNYEVDFVMQKGKKIVAVEVKSGRNPTSLGGLHAFIKKYKPLKTITVSISGIDLKSFLETPVLKWFE